VYIETYRQHHSAVMLPRTRSQSQDHEQKLSLKLSYVFAVILNHYVYILQHVTKPRLPIRGNTLQAMLDENVKVIHRPLQPYLCRLQYPDAYSSRPYR